MTWYKSDLQYFKCFTESVKLNYPSLHQSVVDGKVTLTGMLYLYDCEENELDKYQIKIICGDTYPVLMPEVHEIGGRIPKIADRHFFPKTTRACLLLEDEKYKYYGRNTSITDFIKEIVEPFFLSQTYYHHTGKWLFGERGHGVRGILEFYEEVLGTNDLDLICNFLTCVLDDKIKGHMSCFCGSNLIMRKCHFDLVKDFRTKLSKETIQASLNRLRTFSQNERLLLKRAVQAM